MSIEKQIIKMCQSAQAASRKLALLSRDEKNLALRKMAEALLQQKEFILAANQKDVTAAQKAKYPAALIDRLTLNDNRIKSMIECLNDTEKLPDSVGEVIKSLTRPNGLRIDKVRVPIGVVAIIYESRPNVTSDCIGLCLKSGNAVILKGGKEAGNSNQAIFKVLRTALAGTAVPPAAVALLDSTDRRAVGTLLRQDAFVDLVIPRGGEGLIRFVAENSLIPVVKHYKGVCHTYVSDKADPAMAQEICFNAKVQRPGVCNAMEKMLVHKDIATEFLPAMVARFQQAGVEIRGCSRTRKIVAGTKPATAKDWDEEYLDLILTVKMVDSLPEAIEHINAHGSQHSDAIVTSDADEAARFMNAVDSACLYVNASTRFTDGYEFGLGAEIGISTGKLHARGPMGLEELTTYKYKVYGQGQLRQ
jgi:glutamate-5-semialdehyde dehydrogenase